MYYSSANVSERRAAPPSLAISTVIFALRPSETSGRPTLWLPLVRRIREPFKGLWALPGGPLSHDESLQDAASRNLRETTGLAPNYLEQLYAFGGLHRSPTQRVVSIVYWALVQPTEAALADVSENVRWFRADRLGDLAFDHNAIVDYALWRLRNKLAYGSVAYHLLGEYFTLAQVREVYEASWTASWTLPTSGASSGPPRKSKKQTNSSRAVNTARPASTALPAVPALIQTTGAHYEQRQHSNPAHHA
ncbi:NUDIX hydrolase [Arthrobacter nitrophenolicus]|uniref:NUDIX hydrolase n=1 Tax=Arthrobacter nitrophenolicus TaxID=683150 RepID=L8TVT6_9MICC|nr:NUDIX hydrolase [Arthrobacter nitrophenolicus]